MWSWPSSGDGARVWAINPRKDSLLDLTSRIRRFAEDSLESRNIIPDFRAPEASVDLRLGADARRAVYLIFKEWNEGELQSFLIEITAAIFTKDDEQTGQKLVDVILDKAGSKGTGKWTSQEAMNLPVFGRNPTMLAITLPGVVERRQNTAGTATFSVNGARGRSNNFLLDGTENNDISVAGQAFQIKIPEAVQEVSVQTANYDAEFGRAGG